MLVRFCVEGLGSWNSTYTVFYQNRSTLTLRLLTGSEPVPIRNNLRPGSNRSRLQPNSCFEMGNSSTSHLTEDDVEELQSPDISQCKLYSTSSLPFPPILTTFGCSRVAWDPGALQTLPAPRQEAQRPPYFARLWADSRALDEPPLPSHHWTLWPLRTWRRQLPRLRSHALDLLWSLSSWQEIGWYFIHNMASIYFSSGCFNSRVQNIRCRRWRCHIGIWSFAHSQTVGRC